MKKPLPGVYQKVKEEVSFEKENLTFLREIDRCDYYKPLNHSKVYNHHYLFLLNADCSDSFSQKEISRDKDKGIIRHYEWIGRERKTEIETELCQLINPISLPEFFMNPADFGLDRNEIDLRETNREWERIYEFEEIQIRRALGDQNIRINHVGSTAVKDFIAKPIIDILLEFMPGADKKMVISGLETLGYTHWGYNGVPGREYFTKGTENITYFHLHAFNAGAREATNHRRIVTLLNQIPYYKEKYRQYKLDNCQNNRLSYTENKASLMTAMLTSHEIRLLNRSEFKQGREIVRSYLPDQEEAYNRWYEKYAPYYFGCFIKDQSNVDNNPPESTLIGLAFGLPPWLPCLSRYESF